VTCTTADAYRVSPKSRCIRGILQVCFSLRELTAKVAQIVQNCFQQM
jgi:hypothetical protein